MDREEKEALIDKIDELLDGTREGRALKEVVERLPTDQEQQGLTRSVARDGRVVPRLERKPG